METESKWINGDFSWGFVGHLGGYCSSVQLAFCLLWNFPQFSTKKNVVRPVLMFTLLFSLFVRTWVTWESHNTIMWLSQQNFSKFHERAILVLAGQLSSLSWCELDQSGSANGRQLCPSAETQNDWGVFVRVNAKQLGVILFIWHQIFCEKSNAAFTSPDNSISVILYS